MTLEFARRVAGLFGLTKTRVATLMSLQLGSTVFESISLGLMVPVVQLLDSGSDAQTLAQESRFWGYGIEAFGWLGLEVTVPVLLATVMACILLRQVFTYFRTVYIAHVNLFMQMRVRNKCFDRLLAVRLGYVEGESLGALISDFTVELNRALSFFSALLTLATSTVMMMIYAAMMLAVSPLMTVSAAALLGLAGLLLRPLIARSQKIGQNITIANRFTSSFLVERVRAIRLMRLSGTEAAEGAEMARLNRRQRDSYMTHEEINARISVLVEPVVVAMMMGFLYVGVVQFGLAVETIGLFLVIVLRLLPVAKEMIRTRQTVQSTSSSVIALEARFQAMDRQREHAGGTRELPKLEHGIDFEDVHYAYGKEANVPALNGLTLHIPARRMTALVGPSGSGKSTLIDLLPRMREQQKGRILFDGTPIEELCLTSLRKAISYAPQTPQIFNVSVREHIAYGAPDASQADIERAAELAGAAEFIERLTHGYDTLVGEGGVSLSGGQRQRLDLARALVSGSPVLILDEPTSNLDANTEELFRKSLARIRRETDTTIIVVAHRLSTVSIADRIAVLENGRVVQVGTHDELAGTGGWYSDAYGLQSLDARTVRPAVNGGQIG